MARHTQHPHFEHHRREARLTRRRFQISLLALCLVLSVFVGLQFHGSHADSSYYTVESKNAGFCLAANGASNGSAAILATCQNNSTQQWQIEGGQYTIFNLCLQPLNGGTAQNTKAVIGNCSSFNSGWTQDSDGHLIDGGLNDLCLTDTSPTGGLQLVMQTCVSGPHSSQVWTPFFVTVASTPTPTPRTPTPTPRTPTPTPRTPTPTATPRTPTPTPNPGQPTPTPNPGGGGGSGGGGGGSGGGGGGTGGGGSGGSGGGGSAGSGGGSASTASTPSTPGNFLATASGQNAVIELSWSASSDASGIASYQLERSLDQVTWAILSSSLTDTQYSDAAVTFGVHYYYRIKAIDNAGKDSPYALVDIVTPQFSSDSNGTNSTTFKSGDSVASVVLPSGAVTGQVDCSVSKGTGTNYSTSKTRVVAGPYQLVCKDSSGNTVPAFNEALSWSFNLKNSLKGLGKPAAYTATDTGELNVIQNAKFNTTSDVMAFTTTTTNSVLALAPVKPGIPWNLIILLVVLVGIIGGVGVLILRRQQKTQYDDYLRGKYYNL